MGVVPYYVTKLDKAEFWAVSSIAAVRSLRGKGDATSSFGCLSGEWEGFGMRGWDPRTRTWYCVESIHCYTSVEVSCSRVPEYMTSLAVRVECRYMYTIGCRYCSLLCSLILGTCKSCAVGPYIPNRKKKQNNNNPIG